MSENATCYSCRKDAEKLYRTYWTDEQVCSQCVLHSDEFTEFVFSGQPTPPQVLAAIEASPTVEAVRAAFRLIEPIQGRLFPERKPIATPYGIASIAPGIFVRTARRRKGGRQ